MPTPITGPNPGASRSYGAPLNDVLTTRSIAEPEPLGPDVLFGNRVQPGMISALDVPDLQAKDPALAATLASLAQQSPDTIKQAIRYDPATGGYLVRLYGPFGRPQEIPVTRAEIADNIRRGGVSANDDLLPAIGADPVRDARSIWPSVIEAAYAKTRDSDWSNGLDQGYAAIRRENSPDLVLHALTGSVGEHVGYIALPIVPKSVSLDLLGSRLADALNNGRSAVIETQTERRSLLEKLLGLPGAQDGLNDNQVLTVSSVHRDSNGEWQVEIYKATGFSREEGGKYQGFYVTVPLSKLVDTGGLKDFVLGPPQDLQPGGTFPSPFPGGSGGDDPGSGRPGDPDIRV